MIYLDNLYVKIPIFIGELTIKFIELEGFGYFNKV